ncbi:MAG: stage II sporulation protein D [Clostridiales bacterium]|nr:stage II sporulation protein D [Clostridiales bacterium]
MKRNYPPVWLSALILAILLLWRILGAPITSQQFSDLDTPFWQARILLPSRINRVLILWMPATIQEPTPQTLMDESMDADDRELARFTDITDDQATLMVYLAQESKLVEMTLEGYVCGVLAAEMPAAYHQDALKAQAVAARTRAIYQLQSGGCSEHEGADICTNSSHCQGYATLTECHSMWGNEYEMYKERVTSAVSATVDELLTYNDQLIMVMYHAMSGGTTEAAQTVFSSSVPYLVSVSSSGEESARGFYTDSTFTFGEAAELLAKQFPTFGITADTVQQSLLIGEYTPTGRIRNMLLGGHEILATDFRKALGLRSTWFSLSTDSASITFHQRGYGHGVGMSQVGANIMAANGSTYREILAHYYSGTVIEKQ